MTTPRVWRHSDKAKPTDAIYVGRPSRYGNPFVIGRDGDREEVIRRYAVWLAGRLTDGLDLDELRGRDLSCWCAPLACHGDLLLRAANAPDRAAAVAILVEAGA